MVMPQSEVSSSGHLLDNLVLFGRMLRDLGLDASTDRLMDLARALEHTGITNREDFYHAARASLVNRKEDLPIFDAAFEAFWRVPARGRSRNVLTVSGQRPPQARPVLLAPSLHSRPDSQKQDEQAPQPGEPPLIEATMTYSARAVLRHKDFSYLTPEEMDEVKRLIASFVWQLGDRRTRRVQRGGSTILDMRRTVRGNIHYGGEIMQWAYRQPVFKPRPLVLIADISGSMDRYTRLLLRFIYSMARSLKQPVEAFVFSTHLTRITRQLHRRSVDTALEEVSNTVADWSGGTRIGEALKTFNFEWGQRLLGRGAVTMLISDGWDRGDVDLLQREMARLKRTSYRMIWLNPLLGSAVYEPTARGMQAALPHVDDFLPVHNLESLENLAEHLALLGDRSRSRRAHARHHR
jgi:uncharacterized protein